MKELDFDELDKAVNSLMADPVKKQQSAQAPIKKSEQPKPSPSSASSSVISRSSGGRFMDVVHPSSDMKKPTSPSRPVSRQGVTVEPRATTIVPEEPQPAPPQKEQEPTPATPASAIDQSVPQNEWPDPLEVANFSDTSLASSVEETKELHNQPAQTTTHEEAPETESQPEKKEEPTPLVSPFLPGKKVEKRPLGGALPAEEPPHAPVLGSEAEAKPTDNLTAQLPASPNDTPAQMPEELQSDLVAVESDTNGPWEMPKEEEKPPSKKKAPKTEESAEKLEPMPLPPAPEEKPAAAEAPVPTGPTSIPQQYREEPNTGDSENGAIYDTDAYHQPLRHPAQKKSGWLWVIWIVLILLVGAGGGAALYFFGFV